MRIVSVYVSAASETPRRRVRQERTAEKGSRVSARNNNNKKNSLLLNMKLIRNTRTGGKGGNVFSALLLGKHISLLLTSFHSGRRRLMAIDLLRVGRQ